MKRPASQPIGIGERAVVGDARIVERLDRDHAGRRTSRVSSVNHSSTTRSSRAAGAHAALPHQHAIEGRAAAGEQIVAAGNEIGAEHAAPARLHRRRRRPAAALK